MNLTQMRAIVRRDLHDEDAANYRWTNDEIDRHIARAVNAADSAEVITSSPAPGETAPLASSASVRR